MITVTNEAPKFGNKLEFKKVALGNSLIYSLPKIIDREKLQIKCIVKEKNNYLLPIFVKFNDQTKIFTISPTKIDDIGTY